MAKIVKITVGDVLELKKPHPCGEKKFSVLRVGSDGTHCLHRLRT